METNKPIKDLHGKILGYIWTDSKTKNQKATDFYGRILGFYDVKTDTTKAFSGKILSKGNILASLIMENINK